MKLSKYASICFMLVLLCSTSLARATRLVKITTATPNEPMELSCRATNFRIGPEKSLPVTLRIEGK